MEIISTARIQIRARYDIEEKSIYGKVYSKEDNVYVANVKEEGGNIKLEMLPGFENAKYVKEDFMKIRSELVDYANFWHNREEGLR